MLSSKSISCQWTQDNLGGGGWRSQWVQFISINNQLNHPPDPMSSPNTPAIHLSWLAVILKSAIHRLVGRMLPATAGFWNLHTQPQWSGSNTVGGESPRLHVVSSLLFSLFRPINGSVPPFHPSTSPKPNVPSLKWKTLMPIPCLKFQKEDSGLYSFPQQDKSLAYSLPQKNFQLSGSLHGTKNLIAGTLPQMEDFLAHSLPQKTSYLCKTILQAS